MADILTPTSASADLPRRVPVYARKGRGKVHWATVWWDQKPSETGAVMPVGRTMCAPYQQTAGWSFLTHADVRDLRDDAMCRRCG